MLKFGQAEGIEVGMVQSLPPKTLAELYNLLGLLRIVSTADAWAWLGNSFWGSWGLFSI